MPRPTQQFVKGQTILAEGAQGDRSYKIVSGEVVVCKQNSEGRLVPIAKLGPNEIFGEMYLFDGNNSRTATVIAASTDVVVEVMFQDEMQTMLEKLNPSIFSILKGFSTRLRSTTKKASDSNVAHPQEISKLPDGTMKPSGTTVRRQP